MKGKFFMKNYIFLFFLFLVVSCDNETIIIEPENKEPIIEIDAHYIPKESPNAKYVDVGARIFIYYNIRSVDLSGYSYLGNGIFSKENTSLIPDQSARIIQNPVKILPLFFDREFCIRVESGFYENSYVFSDYQSISDTIRSHIIFR